ncbi:MAG: PAS domain-containing sensor histidine kinase [Kofleriaceae bacterium]
MNLGLIFEHLPNAIMVLDRNLCYVAANAAYLRATGTTLETLLGTYVFDSFPDDPAAPSDNVKLLRASFERVLVTGKLDEIAALRYRVRHEPGGPQFERVWSCRHTPICDVQGVVEYIIQETTEITHLEQTPSTPTEGLFVDRALRAQASLAGLRQMFEQAPGLMCFLRGREHVFEVVNRAYMQLVGHRDVIGMRVADALPEVVEQGFIKLLDNAIATGEPFIGHDIPIQLQRTPGGPLELRYLDFIYQPISDAAGTPVGIFVQGQDITERRLSIEEIKARSEYEQRLIGIVSHDLRNPLNAIVLAAEVLSSKTLDPSAEKLVTRLQRSAERAMRLIADLLDFAKARIGSTIPINRRPANLSEIVEQVVDEFQSVAPSRLIRVGHSGGESGNWDADRIAQVISNLVGNAIQYSSANAPILVNSHLDGDDAVLSICNDGPPISESDREQLFEPFKRGSNTPSSRHNMGLGLFIAREVVTAHGGSISVSSDPGAGNCFTIRLPRAVAQPVLR